MPRIEQQRNMQADEIGLAKQPVAIHEFRVQLLFHLRRRSYRVTVKHAHAKPLSATRHPAADSSKTDYSQSLAPNIAANELIEIPSVPTAIPHPRITLNQSPRDRHQKRPREISGGVVEHSRSVRGHNLMFRARRHVDIVVAN